MQFAQSLIPARLVKRYKRFLADVTLDDGGEQTVHCPNPGRMLGLTTAGSRVWLSRSANRARKLPLTLELMEADGTLVGINTMHPNRIVEESILDNNIKELTGYSNVRREVKYGKENSRIDLLLEGPGLCYVEVKNVTLKRENRAEFPDSVTSRGAKHLRELLEMVKEGHRAVMVYLVQRADCDYFTVAGDIDPTYEAGLRAAIAGGVEVLCYQCKLSEEEIVLDKPLEISL